MKILLPFRVLLATLLLALSAPGFADCLLDGSSYPEGSVVGDYRCENGQWVER